MESFQEALNKARGSSPDLVTKRQGSEPRIWEVIKPFFTEPGEIFDAIATMWLPTSEAMAAVKFGRNIGLVTLNHYMVNSNRELALVERTAAAIAFLGDRHPEHFQRLLNLIQEE